MIAQLGERQTEDLKVPGSIPGRGMYVLQVIYIPTVQRENDSTPIFLVFLLLVKKAGNYVIYPLKV